MDSHLQVCICGWYFYPSLYKTLLTLPLDYEPMVIANRPGNTFGIPFEIRDNIGLEFGAYAHYLRRHWNKRSNVLFLHDDIDVPIQFFEAVHSIPFDQAFIFRNREEYERNVGHGRAMYASAAFLKHAQLRGGIWYDTGNNGFIARGNQQPPPGCQNHNAGIRAFIALSKRIGEETNLTVNRPFYFSSAVFGRRGQLG